MTERRLYLDEAPGERRGVVTLDGLPERLLIARYDDIAIQQAQARVVARVRRIDRTLKSAFVDLGAGPDAVLPLSQSANGVVEGAWLEVEIISPARSGKGAVARVIGAAKGPGRLIAAAPDLETQLQRFAPGAAIIRAPSAREAADLAEETALQVEHSLPGGGRIVIEPTQALVAIDVDLASASGDARQALARANREAVVHAARLLRLKGLGGLVALDLAGKGHNGAALAALAKLAFAPDGAGVSIGPISRFGVFELALPHTATPMAERLLDAGDGRLSSVTLALRLLRRMERAAGPGQFVQAVCAPQVADVAEQLAPELSSRIGPRFSIRSDPSKDRCDIEVTAR